MRGAEGHREELDARVAAVSEHWDPARMAAIDRAILQLAAFELLHREDIPPKVSINEYIEIAKKFSTEDSGAFVNGILDRIWREHAGAAGAGPRDRRAMSLASLLAGQLRGGSAFLLGTPAELTALFGEPAPRLPDGMTDSDGVERLSVEVAPRLRERFGRWLAATATEPGAAVPRRTPRTPSVSTSSCWRSACAKSHAADRRQGIANLFWLAHSREVAEEIERLCARSGGAPPPALPPPPAGLRPPAPGRRAVAGDREPPPAAGAGVPRRTRGERRARRCDRRRPARR